MLAWLQFQSKACERWWLRRQPPLLMALIRHLHCAMAQCSEQHACLAHELASLSRSRQHCRRVLAGSTNGMPYSSGQSTTEAACALNRPGGGLQAGLGSGEDRRVVLTVETDCAALQSYPVATACAQRRIRCAYTSRSQHRMHGASMHTCWYASFEVQPFTARHTSLNHSTPRHAVAIHLDTPWRLPLAAARSHCPCGVTNVAAAMQYTTIALEHQIALANYALAPSHAHFATVVLTVSHLLPPLYSFESLLYLAR